MAKDAVATMGSILPDDVSGRDAVHVAVFSAHSSERLFPGQDVAIISRVGADTEVGSPSTKTSALVGIVDPFLKSAVTAGERFWVYLYPRTITALSHRWSHPAFEETDAIYAPPGPKLASENWLREFCRTSDCPGYEEVMGAVSRVADGESGSDFDDDYLMFLGSDAHGEIPPEFWEHAAVVLGRKIIGPKAKYFTCSC